MNIFPITGSGKTLLGKEVACMLQAARGLKDSQVAVWSPKGTEELQKWMQEEGGLVGRRFALGDSAPDLDSLEMLVTKKKPKVALADEFFSTDALKNPNEFVDSLRPLSIGMDLVVCIRAFISQSIPYIPQEGSDATVLFHQLRTPHRQGLQPYMMAQYFRWHFANYFTPDNSLHEELLKLPFDQPTMWIHFNNKKEVMEMVKIAIRKIKEMKPEINTGLVVCGDSRDIKEVTNLPQGWKTLLYFHIIGLQDKVTPPSS